MSVYFHSNFKLDRDRMSRILELIVKQPSLKDEEVANHFGYKAPFTARYKSWLKKCGILKNKTRVELTDFGSVIYKNDPKFINRLTIWYMLVSLTRNEENAEVWNYFQMHYLPRNKEFSKKELSDAIAMKLMPHSDTHFKMNSPMIKVISKILIDSYLSESAFGLLRIVELKEGKYIRGNTENPFLWKDIEGFKGLY